MNKDIHHSVPLVKLLIDRGADVYAPLNDRETLIHYFFEHAHYEIVRAFLDYADKIDFKTRDSLGRTVFLAACRWTECVPRFRNKPSPEEVPGPLIRLLKDHAVDMMAIDNEGRNVLHHLLDNPDMEDDTILQLLDLAKDECRALLLQKDGKGFSPLHYALRLLRPEICERLLDLGANLLEPDPTGATAGHHIATQYLYVRRINCARYVFSEHSPEYYEGALRLWKRYIDLAGPGGINVRNNDGDPPLFTYLAMSLFDNQRNWKSGTEERCCHVETFETLFDVADLDVHARNNEGEAALHVIARRAKGGYWSDAHDRILFEAFMKKGVDPLAEDAMGRTALDVADVWEKKGILGLFQRE